ncbi:MAG: GNAT family N-acetyltransferase [Clostridia bacterium]|nr:GNAT family N-acetyltransferase [Clostridia bacterium]
MIYYADKNEKKHISALKALCSESSVTACRIKSLYESYGQYGLAQFWVQYDSDGKAVSALSRYGGDMTVYLTENSDMEELKDFITVVGAASVTSEKPVYERSKSSVIMRLTDREKLKWYSTDISFDFTPSLSEIYRLLKQCEGDGFAVPEYEDFLLDTSHRLRHGTALCCAVVKNGKPLAFAMTALSDNTAVIGAVCTHPDYRRTGLGAECVSKLIQQLNGREILIMREQNRNEQFYNSLGFENEGKFYQEIWKDEK